jgi:uncharacterized membrane protein
MPIPIFISEGERTVDNEIVPSKSSTGLEPNIAGMLCYVLGALTGIVFLVIEKESRFVRFHAMQSTIFGVAWFVLNIVLSFIPVIGWMLRMIIGLGGLILWILLMLKAYQGQMYKLPVIGDIAEKQANTQSGTV